VGSKCGFGGEEGGYVRHAAWVVENKTMYISGNQGRGAKSHSLSPKHFSLIVKTSWHFGSGFGGRRGESTKDRISQVETTKG